MTYKIKNIKKCQFIQHKSITSYSAMDTKPEIHRSLVNKPQSGGLSLSISQHYKIPRPLSFECSTWKLTCRQKQIHTPEETHSPPSAGVCPHKGPARRTQCPSCSGLGSSPAWPTGNHGPMPCGLLTASAWRLSTERPRALPETPAARWLSDEPGIAT